VRPEPLDDVERYPGVRGFTADVEEERTVVGKDARRFGGNISHPVEVVLARFSVMIRVVVLPDVVGRRCDYDIDRACRKAPHALDAVHDMDSVYGQSAGLIHLSLPFYHSDQLQVSLASD